MRVKLAVVALGEARAFPHQLPVDREGRARRERDADPRAGLRVVEQLQHPLAVGDDRVRVLHHVVGRQAAVLRRQVHRAARHRHPHAEAKRLLDRDVDGVLESGRIEIVMIGGGGAARDEEFGQRHTDGEAQMAGFQPRPDRIERRQPGKKRLVDRLRMGARQRLVEMVMRVDQARQHDGLRGVVNRIDPLGRQAAADPLGDARPLDDEPSLRALGENRQGVLDPGPHEAVVPRPDACFADAARPELIVAQTGRFRALVASKRRRFEPGEHQAANKDFATRVVRRNR